MWFCSVALSKLSKGTALQTPSFHFLARLTLVYRPILRDYANFICLENCQSPCMLQSDTAIRVPGLLVFIQALTLWLVYTVLVSGPWTDAPWAVKLHLAIWYGNFSPSGKKYSDIQLMWWAVVLGWVTSLPMLAVTSKYSSFFMVSGHSTIGTCFSVFQSASCTNSPMFKIVFTSAKKTE